MDRELAFSTFLKLLELPPERKAATLRGFNRGGGYNYWRPLQNLAPEIGRGELEISAIPDKVAQMAKGHQLKYNQNALITLSKWVGRRRISLRHAPNRVVKPFGKAGLLVRLEPELAFSMEGRDYLMHLWATNTPALSEETLSMGLYFFRYHFRLAGHTSQQFLIFDTVKNVIFAEFQIIDSARAMLVSQRDLLDQIWRKIQNGGEPPRPAPEDRPMDRP